ncbi:reticulon-4 receptor-like 2, partial [Acipenser ruthenus]|uniref:reticulon-4 receptor-like 2 n=1 Tax=Acipenser ruthenus TaxID=7906 RepID=UPI002741EB79
SPSPAYSCPRLCVCYLSPMTVSCQSQNFSAVPAGIPYDSQRVFLQNNCITELRAQSFGFQTQVLWLYSNNICSIKPDSFSDMRDLEELDLGDNPSLRTLHPDSFRGLDKLQSLHIYRCQLGTLPGNIFKKLYSLQFLYLQDNLLQHIQDNLFSDLVNLTHLFLHGNRIRVLSENVFRGLVNLDRLLLHEIRVRRVNCKSFRDLGHLTTLFLFNNALTDLPASAVYYLSSLQFLRLNGNPWSCSCQARPLWEWFRQVRISSSEILCAGPEERKGLDLRFLREIDFAPCPMMPYYPRARVTYTFSTRTRWWFPKSGKASGGNSDKSKGLDGKKGQQQDNSYISPDKSQTKSYEAESTLTKVKEQDYWEKYENEDSTIRCYKLDCLKEANGKSRGGIGAEENAVGAEHSVPRQSVPMVGAVGTEMVTPVPSQSVPGRRCSKPEGRRENRGGCRGMQPIQPSC